MTIAVWDTFVRREDGKIMHFDILVDSELNDIEVIHAYGHKFSQSRSFKSKDIKTGHCSFCHIETPKPELLKVIRKEGYSIIELENCS